MLKTVGETEGTLVIMIGSEISSEAQAAIAASAGRFASDGRRVLLHPLARYNNSVGAADLMPDRKPDEDVVRGAHALLIGGSLQDASILQGKEFVVVQEMFLTDTTEYADVVLPASSFAEVDGTYTNNAGNVQRVRKAIEGLHQSKADWMITMMIAREMGLDLGLEFASSGIFRAIADAVPAYAGLRYPAIKDESAPVQVKHALNQAADVSGEVGTLRTRTQALPDNTAKKTSTPPVGHRLHRVTVMTGKTPQFHLLANGNPKPDNLLVSPLVEFNLDGTRKKSEQVEELVMAVGIEDRTNPGGR
jgi:anaerobic selenocysteine-containing dehydrogenase